MFLHFCLLLGIGSLINFTETTKAPYLKRCLKKDQECPSKGNADIDIEYLAEGIPELGIPSAEPMFFKNITLDQGHFKLQFPNMKVVGTKSCKIKKFERIYDRLSEFNRKNRFESTLTISLDCPFEATGKYKYHGSLSIFEVKNEGKYKVETESIKTTIICKMEKVVKDGKSYWKLLSYDYFYEPVEYMHMNLDNLFSGSFGNAQSFLNFFDEKWWTSAVAVGEPMAKAIVNHFFEALKEFYLQVPINELECTH